MHTIIEDRIKAALEVCAGAVRLHEGDLEFVSFFSGVVTVRLKGACVGCPMVLHTVRGGILEYLKQHIPEVIDVEWIT